MQRRHTSIETKLIHAGEPEPRIMGAVAMPIFQSAMFEYAGETDYHDLKYIRLNNTPNQQVLHAKLAAIESAEAALVTASGMAAISAALLTVLSSGDHLLAQDCLYGGTHDLLTRDFADFGLTFDFIDGNDPGSWKQKLRPNTKAIYVETISNPLMQVPDLAGVARFARENGLVSLIDNTFASPINFRPLDWGFDLSLHSCTKYLNGHSDIVAGAVIGSAELVDRVKRKLDHLGGSLDPHACYLLHRGMKTLALRVRHQNESALRIARFLEAHPRVARVNYPGLESNPGHRRALELFNSPGRTRGTDSAGFGGMLSFEMNEGVEAAQIFMSAVKLPLLAPSLGGVETLLTRPATTSHAGMAAQDRRRVGLSDGLIRMSVGIESTEDLIQDFEQAFQACTAESRSAGKR
jgi:cystathionine beta-lyase/cystathionine gamma-synthase